ncbi:Potassium voltage-gated channel protein Shal [Fasciola gigantica]|uniref:Potassium voltage-gated channel protein Shal n=1 Tax=Fasciola gigantica TaxID=46835 RepID=A0A504Z1G7_FASGI|nr:Potassium voltage-gated channel protein Shal [Fasciola gigantica]
MEYDPCWSPLRQTCALGLAPILGTPSLIKSLVETPQKNDRNLSINVSGVRFVLSSAAVRQFPSTLLGSDEKEYFYDEENQEYFFDRDPELFRYIMCYYYSGTLHFPKNICALAFEEELKFFEILPDHLGDCCYEEYLDRCRDIKDRAIEKCLPVRQKNETVLTYRQKMRNIFEDPAYNDAAQVVYYTTGFFIVISVLSNMAETITGTSPGDLNHPKTYGELYGNIFFCVDTACVVIFTVEYLARLYAAESRLRYVRSIMALIDLVAILPYYISLFVSADKHFSGSLVTLRVFRVFRIFKFSRHSQGLRILGFTLQSCARELGFLLFSLTLVVIIFATVIYYIEKFDQTSTFYSIPASSWYTIVTMTTLGYGDMVPSTVIGKVVGSICSLCGVLVIALPVPVIVSNFSRIYQQNQRADRRIQRKRAQLQALLRQHSAQVDRLNALEHKSSSGSCSDNNEVNNAIPLSSGSVIDLPVTCKSTS